MRWRLCDRALRSRSFGKERYFGFGRPQPRFPSLRKGIRASKAMHNLLPLLSEEELAIFKRGRNMSGGNVPKSATMSEYRAATGMECLFGYLHVLERTERIKELFTMAFPEEEN